jgi:AcrR family transcriptional regulator
VVLAARELFLERGYVATTMSEIAKTAGVALQSVYSAGRSKADLLHLVVDLAVAGDSDDVMLLDRPGFRAVSKGPTAEAQVEGIAALIAETMERLAPIWVAYREADAVDPKAAANLVAAHKRRRETFEGMVGMIPEDRLRRSHEDSALTAWSIGSIDVYLLQRSTLDWSHAEYADWLRRTLVDQLLTPAPRASASNAPFS